jgi:hypothetical protein
MEKTWNFNACSKDDDGATKGVDGSHVIKKNSFNFQFLHKIHREIS